MEQVNKFLCWRCGLPINLAIRFMVSDKGLSHEDCWQAQHDRINEFEKALKKAEEILEIWECEGTLGEGGEELAKIVRDALKGAEAAEKVIRGMFPLWINAMGYCEHGRHSETDVYNRVYEALMEIMDALDVSAQVTAKQIAESAKNLQRAESAEAKVRELEAAARWIPVSERQPEIGFIGLCQVAGNGYTIARYAPYDSHEGWTSDEYGYCAVTHYMPLPQPPKPEEK